VSQVILSQFTQAKIRHCLGKDGDFGDLKVKCMEGNPSWALAW